MGSFLRPTGARSLHFSWDRELLPLTLWPFVSNPELLSRLTGDLIEFGGKPGDIGKIKISDNQSETIWNLETIENENLSSLRFIVIGNPWHHRPDIMESSIGFSIKDRLHIDLDGFDISHHSDTSLSFASWWGWTRMANIVAQLGGNPEAEISAYLTISAWINIKASPDEIRKKILKPEEAVKWLCDEADIDPRLSGRISLRWIKPYMSFILHGTISCFEPDRIEMTIKENPLSKNRDIRIIFDITQSGQESRLALTLDGISAEPWASFASLYLCDAVQIALTGLAMIYSKNIP